MSAESTGARDSSRPTALALLFYRWSELKLAFRLIWALLSFSISQSCGPHRICSIHLVLKIALIHYHLGAGGVTKVISAQAKSLLQMGWEPLVLSAGPTPRDFPHRSVPLLNYLETPPTEHPELYQILLAECIKHWGAPPDLWHIHNHSLGKNILFPQLIQQIANSLSPLILQPHDFAEDNRARNYDLIRGQRLYPTAPQIHYAFVNSRDQSNLENTGLPVENSHLLPNIIAPPALSQEPQTNTKSLVLYPVRGIRRKNIGETVLLAALAPASTRFAISLAPSNPVWQDIYQTWQDFAHTHRIPVQFSVVDQVSPSEGSPTDFRSWLQESTHLLTTSISEGFGLTFLEPIALNKPLLGRDLPEITRDFRNQGINPGSLYQSIPASLHLLDQEALRKNFEQSLQQSYRHYRYTLTAGELDDNWKLLTAGGKIDFGVLPEAFQQELIERELTEPESLFPDLKNWLAKALTETQNTNPIEKLHAYSSEQAQTNLRDLYESATSTPRITPTWLCNEEVLTRYLSPQQFHILSS